MSASDIRVPFVDLRRQHHAIEEELTQAIQRVIRSGWFIRGPEVEAFESEFATFCQTRHCVGVGNGLDAIELLLRAYGIGPGDEVIVPSNTFIATWLAVSEVGATVVPVEPDPLTHNIDPARIADAITARTRCIIPVHLYGQPADMDPIMALAKDKSLVVIEDNAQAQGALYKGRPTGSLGHAAATSFYPGKNLGALGDGGAVVTNDEHIAAKVRMLGNYGSTQKYKHELRGKNSRLDELQAAVLRVKLRALPRWNEERRQLAEMYSQALTGSQVSVPSSTPNMQSVWHLYVVESERREQLQRHLADHGVQTVIHYPVPPHHQPCYKAMYGHLPLPVAERLANRVLSLPLFPGMTTQEVSAVANAVHSMA